MEKPCTFSTAPQTLISALDLQASSDGKHRIWAQYFASSQDLQSGNLQDVTFGQLANAVNRTAWWLEDNLGSGRGPAGDRRRRVVCYIGPSDLRYFVFALAAFRSGRVALFSSPRNQLDAHIALMKASECQNVVSGYDEANQTQAIEKFIKAEGYHLSTLPSLPAILDPEPAPVPPWTAPDEGWDALSRQDFMLLHTSGSTGIPKLVGINHGLLATIDAQRRLPAVDGRRVTAHEWANSTIYTALPPFHSAGINFLAYSIFQNTQMVVGPPDAPPSLSTLERILDLRVADAAVLPPSLLTEAAAEPEILRKMSQWSSVAYGGAPLPQTAGDTLWDLVRVLHLLGSTETFSVPELVPVEKDEWPYHKFHPGLGIDFRPSVDGLHELVFTRHSSSPRKEHQGAFWTFPDLEEYSMKDVYQRHPRKADLWLYKGRVDDTVVLANGEKFNPSDVERGIVGSISAVDAALIVGSGKEQPALLIQPCTDVANNLPGQLVQTALDHASSNLPGHAQLDDDHVRVVSPTAFERGMKGETHRRKTESALVDTITDIYQRAGSVGSDGKATTLDFSSTEALTESLQYAVSSNFLKGKPISKTDKLFAYGFDSLQATRLARHIEKAADAQHVGVPSCIPAKLIYQHPQVGDLANAVMSIVRQGEIGAALDEGGSSIEEMQNLLKRYHDRIDKLSSQSREGRCSEHSAVLLTGSTGSLGSYILHDLVSRDEVDQIYCLNRSGGTVSKQSGISSSRGLSDDFSRVKFLEADLANPDFGLGVQDHDDLKRSATHIIHNAWPVDFNMALSEFEAQLESCFRLIEFACEAEQTVSITFLSSIGAANDWCEQNGSSEVPEVKIEDLSVSERMGYAQSKQLAELIFARAAEQLGIPVTVCRVGQITGPVNGELARRGKWNPSEWFPSVLTSSVSLGKVPDSLAALDRMDWIPVDLLARIVGDLGASRPSDQGGTASSLHLVNPQHSYWSQMVSKLVTQQPTNMIIVPYDDWLEALATAADANDDNPEQLQRFPAVKLMDFLKQMSDTSAERPVFDTSVTRARCPGLGDVPAVSVEWIDIWMRQLGLTDDSCNGRN